MLLSLLLAGSFCSRGNDSREAETHFEWTRSHFVPSGQQWSLSSQHTACRRRSVQTDRNTRQFPADKKYLKDIDLFAVKCSCTVEISLHHELCDQWINDALQCVKIADTIFSPVTKAVMDSYVCSFALELKVETTWSAGILKGTEQERLIATFLMKKMELLESFQRIFKISLLWFYLLKIMNWKKHLKVEK